LTGVKIDHEIARTSRRIAPQTNFVRISSSEAAGMLTAVKAAPWR
jgi:hypothetical protein